MMFTVLDTAATKGDKQLLRKSNSQTPLLGDTVDPPVLLKFMLYFSSLNSICSLSGINCYVPPDLPPPPLTMN